MGTGNTPQEGNFLGTVEHGYLSYEVDRYLEGAFAVCGRNSKQDPLALLSARWPSY